MRMASYTDLILMKIKRTKQIEDNKGQTLISEGVDANYFDMINYAMFGLIKMEEGIDLKIWKFEIWRFEQQLHTK